MKPTNVTDIDSLSKCSVHLSLFYNNQKLASGTGLLACTITRSTFLITALHNLTGREPDGRCKSNTSGLPNFVEIKGYHYQKKFPLYDQNNDPSTGNPLFWRHPQGPRIDICVLPIFETIDTASPLGSSFLDPSQYSQYVKLFISQMCYVIGYPEGLYIKHSDKIVLPIWKTGHIASEPSVFIDGIPKLLIDASTCEGMSGSPVFTREPNGNRLLGIYTGRTSQISELGYVFSPEAIIKILDTGPIHGTIQYQ